MNTLEQELMRQETGGVEPRLCLRSKTRVDAGRWWRRTPVWLCVMEHEMLLLAVARRRYVERVSLGDCPDSHYSATTGELVLAPGEELRFNRFALSPRNAVRVLEFLNTEHGIHLPKDGETKC